MLFVFTTETRVFEDLATVLQVSKVLDSFIQ